MMKLPNLTCPTVYGRPVDADWPAGFSNRNGLGQPAVNIDSTSGRWWLQQSEKWIVIFSEWENQRRKRRTPLKKNWKRKSKKKKKKGQTKQMKYDWKEPRCTVRHGGWQRLQIYYKRPLPVALLSSLLRGMSELMGDFSPLSGSLPLCFTSTINYEFSIVNVDCISNLPL